MSWLSFQRKVLTFRCLIIIDLSHEGFQPKGKLLHYISFKGLLQIIKHKKVNSKHLNLSAQFKAQFVIHSIRITVSDSQQKIEEATTTKQNNTKLSCKC